MQAMLTNVNRKLWKPKALQHFPEEPEYFSQAVSPQQPHADTKLVALAINTEIQRMPQEWEQNNADLVRDSQNGTIKYSLICQAINILDFSNWTICNHKQAQSCKSNLVSNEHDKNQIPDSHKQK